MIHGALHTYENEIGRQLNQSNQGPQASLHEAVWNTGIRADYSGLSREQQTSFADLLEEYEAMLAPGDSDLGRTHLMVHAIDTGSATPIKQAPRQTPFKKEEVARQLCELMTRERIESSNSPWSSPIVLARKHDGSYRLCIDYKRLAVTAKDANPVTSSEDRRYFGIPRWGEVVQLSRPGLKVLAGSRCQERPAQNCVRHASRSVPVDLFTIWKPLQG